MRNYNDFSYRPDYGFELYKDDKLLVKQQRVVGAVCFSWVFNFLDRHNSNHAIFKGIYTLKCRKNFVERSGNYCVLSKENVIKVMNVIRKNFDIQVNLKETDDNFEFMFTVVGKPIKHKFILTFSRVFFEYPYKEGDGKELEAVQLEKCSYSSFYKTSSGYIIIKIFKDHILAIYEDNINMEKYQIEKSTIVLNDI